MALQILVVKDRFRRRRRRLRRCRVSSSVTSLFVVVMASSMGAFCWLGWMPILVIEAQQGGGQIPTFAADDGRPNSKKGGQPQLLNTMFSDHETTAIADDTTAEVDDSTKPKVVLRPRTRIKLEQEEQQQQERRRRAAALTAAAAIAQPSPNPKQQRPISSASAPAVFRRDNNSKERQPGGNNNIDREQMDILQEERQADEFLNWCKHVLGIDTILEIQTFIYNRNSAMKPTIPNYEDDIDDSHNNEQQGKEAAVERTVTATTASSDDSVLVRGLAASRDIAEGETLIQIPMQALLSIKTTIDQDPVLAKLMGPTARKEHGWEDNKNNDFFVNVDDVDSMEEGGQDDNENDGTTNEEEDDDHFYEIPLLAVAILHHRRLGDASPIAPYIRILLHAPIDDMPFLWSAEELRDSASEGVRIIARGIRQEMKTMYKRVVQALIDRHPDTFGPPPQQQDSTMSGGDHEDEWMFSYEKFQWAFAIVNSRHWHLRIGDLSTTPSTESVVSKPSPAASSFDGQVPPADTPTESWVQEHGDVDDEIPREDQLFPNVSLEHSFLAPVADLLNFGPPCTTVNHNKETQTFEIISTCALKKGEEVTFWYSNECEDVIFGVYGFSHPLIPKCRNSEEWHTKAESLQAKLKDAYEDLQMLEEELEYVEEKILGDCDCEEHHNAWLRHEDQGSETITAPTRSSGRSGSRRSRNNRNTQSKHQRIRRSWSRKTEF